MDGIKSGIKGVLGNKDKYDDIFEGATGIYNAPGKKTVKKKKKAPIKKVVVKEVEVATDTGAADAGMGDPTKAVEGESFEAYKKRTAGKSAAEILEDLISKG